MASTFDTLNQEILNGMNGDNQFIPIGFPKLGKYANLRKNILTLIFSTTGAGKSSLVDSMILNSTLYHIKHPTSMKPDFQLFSMERNSRIRVAKWICYLIFVSEGEVIPLPKMLGWWEEKLDKKEYSLFLKQKELIDHILNEYITIHDGAKTPKEIYKILKDHFESKGEYDVIKTIDQKTGREISKRIYIPNNTNEIVSPVIDHGNLTKTTQELPTKKAAIDKLVEFMQIFRDLEGAAPIWIAQVNRAIASVSRMKDGEHELLLEDAKESGDIGDASDIAISLFDALKYGQSSKTGYDPKDLVDLSTGESYFRSAQILKSSYGADSIRIPLAFNGFCGQMVELPKRKDLTDEQYNNLRTEVLNKSYFLK